MAIPSYGGFPLWNDQPVDPYANGWQPFNGRNAGVQAGFSALTNLGAGLLSGRNWSEGLSRGLMGANQGFQDSMQNARRDYYVDQQGRYMQRKMQQEDRQNEREDAAAARKQAAIEDVIASPPAGVDPTQWATQVRANPEGYLNAYAKSAFETPKAPERRTRNIGASAVDEQWNGKTGQWEQVGTPYPRWKAGPDTVIQAPKTIEERDQQVLLQGDPASPAYAMAYTRTFLTPHYVQTNNGVVPIMPAVPPNIRPPAYAATGQAAPQGGGTTPQAADAIPGTAPPMNQDQANAAGFADRMASAGGTLDKLGAPGKPFVPSRGDWYGSQTPVVGNSMVSPQWQQFDQARRNFINAQLRRESGAAISQGEFDNANAQYFPVPGDSPEVLQQKAQNRAQAVANMQRAAGPQYKPAAPAPAPQQSAPPGAPGKIEYHFENGVLIPGPPGGGSPNPTVGRW